MSACVAATAHRIDVIVRDGEYRNLADAARVIGVSRPRMTQIMNLLLLAPGIQESILGLEMAVGRDPVTERELRPIVAEPDWTRQLFVWKQVL